MDAAYCARRAEECEFHAAQEQAPRRRLEWLRMAGEWRLTPSTTQPDGAPPAAHPDGAPLEPDEGPEADAA